MRPPPSANAESGVGRAQSRLERAALGKGVDITLGLRLVDPIFGLHLDDEVVLVLQVGDLLGAELAPLGGDLGAHALGGGFGRGACRLSVGGHFLSPETVSEK